MKLFIFSMMFLAAVIGIAIFSAIEDPIWNFTEVPATVEAFTPQRKTSERVAGLSVTKTTPATLSVKLENGSVWKTSLEPVASDKCVHGGPATATIRIGQITHKVLSVSFGLCESREATR